MILVILLGFATLAVMSSLVGSGEAKISDPITAGEDPGDLILGGQAEATGPVRVTDFPKTRGTLVLPYDETDSPPELTLRTTTNRFGEPEDAHLFADGELVAVIQGRGGDFGLDNVVLTPVHPTASRRL